MPRPRSDSREKIVEAARTLFRKQGYHGSPLGDIIALSGAPRGSVYFLFPGGKEEISVAAVDVSAQTIPALIAAARAESRDLAEWIETVIATFAAELTESGFTDGCPITTVALETVPTSRALHESCRNAYGAWLTAIEDVLRASGIPKKTVPALATTMLAGLEGALVLCRIEQSIDPLNDVAGQLIALASVYTDCHKQLST